MLPVVALVTAGFGLRWMENRNIYLRPFGQWMLPERKLVSATPTHPTRITFERSAGILTFKRPIPITAVNYKLGRTIYIIAPQPELPNGGSFEFPNKITG